MRPVTPERPDPPAFAPYGTAAAGRAVIATAGIAALDPVTMRPVHEDFDVQARWVLDRLDAVLADAGATRHDLLRVECFLADRSLFGRWNGVFAERFGERPPARTTLVCGLPVPGLLIEVQALATSGP
ncbi:RidA family protein [Actinomadura sp. NTSP31]|uniref:RidA family protein n=1 Tax=Actinomadura sp. NTSP31 TaxID=1735447 RepID=UPI0035C0140D